MTCPDCRGAGVKREWLSLMGGAMWATSPPAFARACPPGPARACPWLDQGGRLWLEQGGRLCRGCGGSGIASCCEGAVGLADDIPGPAAPAPPPLMETVNDG